MLQSGEAICVASSSHGQGRSTAKKQVCDYVTMSMGGASIRHVC